MNLVVVAAVAVTSAVLIGALVVGDSMRWSLRHLTLERLGRVHHVLLNDRFFPADLEARLARQTELAAGDAELVGVILLRGSAVQAATERRASGVQVVGIDGRFSTLFDAAGPSPTIDFTRDEAQLFPSVVLSEALAADLGAAPGDELLLSLGRPAEIPTASLLGRRESHELASTLRLSVKQVLSTRGAGRFGLEARQSRPRTAYLELPLLQQRLDRPGQLNALLVASGSSAAEPLADEPTRRRLLQSSLELEDLGVRLRREGDGLVAESRELILRPELAREIERLARQSEVIAWPVLTYLANLLQLGERAVPYSTLTALRTPVPSTVGELITASGVALPALGPREIALSEWTAADLQAAPGDAIELSYYVVGADDRLATARTSLRVAAVVSQSGLAVDRSFTPEVPGISDAQSMASWNPPFPVDLELIRPQDEEYWDRYRGAPKAFVDLSTGQRLWRSRFGEVTSIRLAAGDADRLERFGGTLRRDLPRQLAPESAGFRWLSVRAQGLRGASGTTDFSGLFLGFSLFLIVAALLLVALLFSLLVQQRAREAGLLLAVGFPVRRVRRRLLAEGGLLASLGALAGSGLALFYAALVLRGLEVWWLPVVEAPFLRLSVRLTTLAGGGAASLALSLLVIARTVQRLSRVPASRLLAGATELREPRRRRWAARIGGIALVLAAALSVTGFVVGLDRAPALFFGVGAASVVAGIALYAEWSRRTSGSEATLERLAIVRMAIRNGARNPGRSLLSVALVACASFVLVSVAANRKSYDAGALGRHSGTGGLTLVAEAETALPAPLRPASPAASGSAFFSFRVRPGDDASCLNLYRPERPRLLGVPAEFVERGGFGFRAALGEVDNPWTLLHQRLEDDAIPAIGDYNSVRWILHSGLGKELTLDTRNGRPVRARIVALLDTSIFQSELLISEASFREHFPDLDGFGFFLGELPNERVPAAVAELERELSAFGLDAGSTRDRLAGYQAVENMYLSTFEVLGGLGLLLGTLGLGVVLLRNVLERRAELATLRAFGYRRATLGRLVVAENVLLLVVGLAIGGAAGLLAVAPHLMGGAAAVPWSSLLLTLAAVFAIGLLASLGAVLGSLRVPLLPALKAD